MIKNHNNEDNQKTSTTLHNNRRKYHSQPTAPRLSQCSIHRTRSIVERLPTVGSCDTVSLRKRSEGNHHPIMLNSTMRVRRHTVQVSPFDKQSDIKERKRAFTDSRLHGEALRIIFRRIIRLVRALCRVCIAIRRYAVNKNDSRVLLEFQNFLKPPAIDNLPTLNSNNANSGPYFNKHIYSVENNHTFPAWARFLCSQPSEYRKQEDLIKLRSYLRGHSSFAQFDYETQMVICQNVVYNRYDKKRIILNQGDNPEYFYIMISGSVYVNISHRDTNTGVEITETVDELKGHCSFGATGLMYNTKRTASVVSDSYVEVLLIDASTFLRHCSIFLTTQHEKQKLFLHSHEVFKTWSSRRIKLLSYDIKCRFYRAGKIVDLDIMTSKYIYFVMYGAVDVFYKNELDDNRWLHSSKLKRHVGVLAGNRIIAPNSCNLSSVLKNKESRVDLQKQNIKVLIISNGATILYVPRSRFQEIAPKQFLAYFEPKTEFLYLTDRDYERERRKAVRWMEFRDRTTNDTIRCPTKQKDHIIIPKLICQ